jgi:hypothetical protein
MIDEHMSGFYMTAPRYLMQGSAVESALSIYIRTMLDEQLSEFHTSTIQCAMQRSRLVIAPDIHICAMIDKQLSEFYTSAVRRGMQGSPLASRRGATYSRPCAVVQFCVLKCLGFPPQGIHLC